MAGMQYVGREPVVQAFENRQLDTWALFQGKQFLTAGAGSEDLDTWLSSLEPAGSAALYTLKVYRDYQPDEITDKTEAAGSFNFKLASGVFNGLGHAGAGVNSALLARLDALQKRLDELESDREPDEPASIGGIISGLLEDPEKLAVVGTVIARVITAIKGNGARVAPESAADGSGAGSARMAAVGAVRPAAADQPAGDLGNESLTADQAILVGAVDRLARLDPNIAMHLDQLATLGEKKPAFFKMLLQQLESL